MLLTTGDLFVGQARTPEAKKQGLPVAGHLSIALSAEASSNADLVLLTAAAFAAQPIRAPHTALDPNHRH